jgi:hypothetical protein
MNYFFQMISVIWGNMQSRSVTIFTGRNYNFIFINQVVYFINYFTINFGSIISIIAYFTPSRPRPESLIPP